MEILNTHHFNKNTKLIYINNNIDIYSINTGNKLEINTIQNMILKINTLYEFISIPDYLKNISVEKLKNIIFPLNLEFKITICELHTCGCNHGHCGAITHFEITKECTTYKDILELLPEEYPDSVFLYIDHIKTPPEYIYNKVCGEKNKIKNPIKLNPNSIYVSFCFSR